MQFHNALLIEEFSLLNCLLMTPGIKIRIQYLHLDLTLVWKSGHMNPILWRMVTQNGRIGIDQNRLVPFYDFFYGFYFCVQCFENSPLVNYVVESSEKKKIPMSSPSQCDSCLSLGISVCFLSPFLGPLKFFFYLFQFPHTFRC